MPTSTHTHYYRRILSLQYFAAPTPQLPHPHTKKTLLSSFSWTISAAQDNRTTAGLHRLFVRIRVPPYDHLLLIIRYPPFPLYYPQCKYPTPKSLWWEKRRPSAHRQAVSFYFCVEKRCRWAVYLGRNRGNVCYPLQLSIYRSFTSFF